MSKTFRSEITVGREYWSARPSKGLREWGRRTKKFTHRLERIAARREIYTQLAEVA